ncbi:MAG: group II intron reverse transcriptase/maturase [Sinobacteraceae bacterium]|nr:group II intron reverse transcriptase/maturase [Nevskiaceae bacterium]
MRQRHRATTDDSDVPLPEAFAVNGGGLPENLFTLRQKLYRKAKREPTFRFYTLYGLIARLDVLEAAWALVAANDGAPGVDGVTIATLKTSPAGVQQLVQQLQHELQTKEYRPQAVRRVYIPKPDGQQRPLGIPTVRDRVVQMAAKLILEPIFEADFLEVSYGYRPGRTAHDALKEIARRVQQGYCEIYDADLQAYFDSIPHDKLLKCVERRVADRQVLRLLRLWLTAPVEDRDEGGRPRRQRPTQGTPQGGVISPLLANLYLHWLDVRFSRAEGPGTWAGAHLVRYADDFVVLARYIGHRIPQWIECTVEEWLGLTINRRKTRIVKLSPSGVDQLDFLGYTFRYDWDQFGRQTRYFTAVPSKRALARGREALRQRTGGRRSHVPIPVVVADVNRFLRGWQQYFQFGHARRAQHALTAFAIARLMRHLRRRSQRPVRPPDGMTWYGYITRSLGLQPGLNLPRHSAIALR